MTDSLKNQRPYPEDVLSFHRIGAQSYLTFLLVSCLTAIYPGNIVEFKAHVSSVKTLSSVASYLKLSHELGVAVFNFDTAAVVFIPQK